MTNDVFVDDKKIKDILFDRGMVLTYEEVEPSSPEDMYEVTFYLNGEIYKTMFIRHDKSPKKKAFNILLDEIIDNSENSSKATENHYYLNCYPSQSYFGNINLLKDELDNLQKQDWKIFIYTNNENQSLRIHEILKKYTQPEEKSVFPVTLIDKEISEGFVIPDIKVKVIHENEIFARKKYIAKTSHRVKSKAIDTFVDLNPGDYIVHVSYGIGIFKGIDRVRAVGNERDYIKLEYADEEFVFVPIEQVNLIQEKIK